MTTISRERRQYLGVLGDLTSLLQASRAASARSINAVMTATYWLVGRRIVEGEQRGRQRAGYGERLLERLARDLSKRFGRGFGRRNLEQMRAFFLARPEIPQMASAESAVTKTQTASAEWLPLVATRFPLPWSHYVRLLSVKSPAGREFYEREALRGGWTHEQLDRQIQSQFYERTSLSKRGAPLAKGPVSAADTLKSPFVLEFLDLKDEYSENDLEEALIGKLETFLLELGGAFAFIGRQRRLRVGDEWYRVDLLFFHRELRCLVVVDLKLGKFTHADAGQMHLYLNYAREHLMLEGENPPVGLILCAEKDQAVAHYALEGLPNQVLAAEYRTALPDEKTLAAEVHRSQLALVARGAGWSEPKPAPAALRPRPRRRSAGPPPSRGPPGRPSPTPGRSR